MIMQEDLPKRVLENLSHLVDKNEPNEDKGEKTSLVLASGSKTRADVLKKAGFVFDIYPSTIDEEDIRSDCILKGFSPKAIARQLAMKKACDISKKHPHALVIGADQILECQGSIINKAKDEDEAFEKLKTLAGRSHFLHSGVALYQNGEAVYDYVDTAEIVFRALNDDEIRSYMMMAKDAVLRSVGSYEVESHGILLIDQMRGDFNTVLGLPLLPLISSLRKLGYDPLLQRIMS